MSTHESQEHQASSYGVKKCTHLERLGMDDRNVALSEQAMINAPDSTDYDENTMVDVEVMSEKPASLSETWHSTSSTTPPSAATAQRVCTQPVDNYKLESIIYTTRERTTIFSSFNHFLLALTRLGCLVEIAIK